MVTLVSPSKLLGKTKCMLWHCEQGFRSVSYNCF